MHLIVEINLIKHYYSIGVSTSSLLNCNISNDILNKKKIHFDSKHLKILIKRILNEISWTGGEKEEIHLRKIPKPSISCNINSWIADLVSKIFQKIKIPYHMIRTSTFTFQVNDFKFVIFWRIPSFCSSNSNETEIRH